jgi:hypothetical protein
VARIEVGLSQLGIATHCARQSFAMEPVRRPYVISLRTMQGGLGRAVGMLADML